MSKKRTALPRCNVCGLRIVIDPYSGSCWIHLSERANQDHMPDICPLCGPQERPALHSICHPTQYRMNGCGHALADHSDTLKCRVCGLECGIACHGIVDLDGVPKRSSA
jgi:hypothetical protein